MRWIFLFINATLASACIGFIALVAMYEGDYRVDATILAPVLIASALSMLAFVPRANSLVVHFAIGANVLMLVIVAFMVAVALTGIAGLFGAVFVLVPSLALFATNCVLLWRGLS